MQKKYIVGFVLVAVAGVMMLRGPLSAKIEDTTEPELTAEELREYERLGGKNANAKNFLNDLKVFAQLSNSLAESFKEKQLINGIEVPVRSIMQAVVGALYNISELGLGIIRISEEQADPLRKAAGCLKFTDKELRAVAAGKLSDDDIEICTAAGYTTKRKVVAGAVLLTADGIKTIFDNAVIKYNSKTGKAERGLLFNIDFVIDQILGVLLQSTKFQDALNKMGSGQSAPKKSDKQIAVVENKSQQSSQAVKDARALLGVSDTATAAEIGNARNKLALTYHPDRLPEGERKAGEEKMMRINEARDLLIVSLEKPTAQQPEGKATTAEKKTEIPSTNLERVKKFRADMDKLRTIITFSGIAVSGVLEAMMGLVGALEPSALPEAKKQEYKEAFHLSQEIKIPTDEDLDSILFDIVAA